MATRHQTGHVFRKGGFWYVRYYDSFAEPDGRIVRHQVCHKVAPFCDRFRTKRDVMSLVEELLLPVNAGGCLPESVLPVGQFIEHHYLPFVDQEKRASTAKGYRDIWRFHLTGRLDTITLRDFRPVDGQRLLQDIAKTSGYHLSRTTLKHIKSFLSGVFTYARRQGVVNTSNPMQGASIPHGREPQDTYAYSLEEIMAMLGVLPDPARVLVAVAAFTGLRRSEIRGLRWEDYQAPENCTCGEIQVERSVWRRQVQPTKTARSRAGVPVIPALAEILAAYRMNQGNPQTGFVFSGQHKDKPFDLDTFARRYIEPILVAHGQHWRWWHPFRRGLATNLHRLGVHDKAIQAILRHSSVQTTREIYIKSVGADSIAAMELLDVAIKNKSGPPN